EVVKEVVGGSADKPLLTIFKSGFTLTPSTPLQDDPDFLNRFENTKNKEVYFDYSKYTGGDYVFIDNQVLEGKPEKDLDKYAFHPDNPSIKKLLAKNHLQQQNRRYEFEFIVFYLERDIEKYDPHTRTYYLNNEAKVKNAKARKINIPIKIVEIMLLLCERRLRLRRVLEIGTGCGNLVISLAKNQPNWNFWAADINQKALKVAKNNSTIHQVKNIEFIYSDLFDRLKQGEKFNIIVSNPPYVSVEEYKKLSPAVKAQPVEALVAENEGHQQAEKVIKLIIEYFPQAEVSIFPDDEERSRYNIKIEKQVVKVGNDEYEIRTKDGGEQPIEFTKGEKNELSDKALDLQYRKKGEGDDK
ncbi:7649_t:CDS:2, partial [Ambispora leptoticha]